MIGYHQPNSSTYRTVYPSCLKLNSVIGQSKGQLAPHACVKGQNPSCVCAVDFHFTALTVV